MQGYFDPDRLFCLPPAGNVGAEDNELPWISIEAQLQPETAGGNVPPDRIRADKLPLLPRRVAIGETEHTGNRVRLLLNKNKKKDILMFLFLKF